MPIVDDVVLNRSRAAFGSNVSIHASPPLLLLAVVHAALLLASLSIVAFTRGSPYPGPWDSGAIIAAYFVDHASAVMVASSLQFAAAIVLGLFTATLVSRLQFLGVRAAGASIAMTGSVLSVLSLALSAVVLWVGALPVVAGDVPVIRTLFYLGYVLGGVASSVPFGLFLAGAAIPCGVYKLLPRWLVAFGVLLAVAAVVSWFALIWPALLFLVSLTRFAGLIWLIAAGALLPKSVWETAP